VKSIDKSNFFRTSLTNQIDFSPSHNDVGIEQVENSIQVDKQKTFTSVQDWIKTWKDIKFQEEINFCKQKQVDLIITDITPFPYLVADKLKIPSLAISNFNWYNVYKSMGLDTTNLEFLRECYQYAENALILPFEGDMTVFKNRQDVGLVSREISEDKQSIFKKIGKKRNSTLIFLGIGKSISPNFLKNVKLSSKRYDFLLSFQVNNYENVFKIPSNETESQNFVNACDLMISKCGYSTVAEGTRSKIPIFLFKRPVPGKKNEYISEDLSIISNVEKLGIGKELNLNLLYEDRWERFIENQKEINKSFQNLPIRYKKNGCIDICEIVKQYLK